MSERVILVTGGFDHTIRFWQAPSGVCHRVLQYNDCQVNCLEITPDKQFLAGSVIRSALACCDLISLHFLFVAPLQPHSPFPPFFSGWQSARSAV